MGTAVVDTNFATHVAAARRSPARARTPADAPGVPRAIWSALFGAGAPEGAAIDDLQAIVTTRALPAGSLLLSRQEPARELLVLAQGDAALGSVQDGGPFQPERSLQGPAWLDAASAWLGGVPAQDALALSDVQLLALPQAALAPLLARHPALAHELLLVLARQVHQLTAVAHDLMHKDAETRFSAWLLQRCAADPATPGRALVTLHERKRDIAAQLGITPETLSRLLRQLSRKGLIAVKGYTVTVQDLAGLRAVASA